VRDDERGDRANPPDRRIQQLSWRCRIREIELSVDIDEGGIGGMLIEVVRLPTSREDAPPVTPQTRRDGSCYAALTAHAGHDCSGHD